MCRPYGSLTLVYALMREVYKDLMENQTDEETWSWVARDILLDTWTALLLVFVSAGLAYITLICYSCMYFLIYCPIDYSSICGLEEHPSSFYLCAGKLHVLAMICLGKFGIFPSQLHEYIEVLAHFTWLLLISQLIERKLAHLYTMENIVG